MIIIEDLKQFLFDKVTQEEIYEFYFKKRIVLREFYANPLRVDTNADCQFYYSPKGVLRLNDFAWNKKIDCFDFVKFQYNLTYYQALIKIIIDMKLLSSDDIQFRGYSLEDLKIHKIKLQFKVKRKKFTKLDIDYWRRYLHWLVPNDLEQANIYSLDCLWINDKITYDYKPRDIAFIYHLKQGDNFQAYFVKSKMTTKFILNNNRIIIGKKHIDYNKSYLIITKSYKDWFLAWKMGLNVVAILSETLYTFPIEIISKFNYVFTLFDNDKTGKKCSVIYRRTFNTIPLLFKTGYKDFSDNLEQFGEEKMQLTIKQTKQYYGIID